MSDIIGLFGQLAIEKKFVTPDQVRFCLKVQAQLGGKHHLGALLINRGFLTEAQMQELLALQRERQAQSQAPAIQSARSLTPLPTPLPVPSASSPPVATGAAAGRIPGILESAEKRGASDVHFHPGTPPAMRQGGRLLVASQPPLEDRELAPQLRALLTLEERSRLAHDLSLDALVVTPSRLRCRASFYFTNTGLNATFRLVRRAPPTLEELGLPSQLASFVSHSQGMVLVTGLAGSGKTSTLAALVNLIAEERSEHVLCLEDPIEIIHQPKKALVNQRQVGRDTESFARALRGALREDPDVIVIGELRDAETISLAVTAAETGHLVIGSMNTATSARAISRVLGAFPPAQQAQVRAMVSESLHGVITQRLMPTLDGGRVAALEVLMVTPAIGNLIRDDKLFQIRSQIQTGRQLGMRLMDDSLRDLVLSGRVAPEDARRVAENPALIPAAAAPPSAPPPAAPISKPGAPRMPTRS
jgi:twitching motility protein PilT